MRLPTTNEPIFITWFYVFIRATEKPVFVCIVLNADRALFFRVSGAPQYGQVNRGQYIGAFLLSKIKNQAALRFVRWL
jgi:hypothetical protein